MATAEPSEVHDLGDTGATGCGCEVGGRATVEILEVADATHRVDKVVGRSHAFESGGERVTIEEVAPDDLGPGMSSAAEDRRPAGEASNQLARGFESVEQ